MVKPTVTLHLRTRQARFLSEVASREDISLSRALARVIESYKPNPTGALPPPRARKAMRHLAITPSHLAVLDKLALDWGLTRTDVARRLIDEACDQELERLSA